MTPEQALTLGRRAVASKHWRWPGPLANETRGVPVLEIPVGESERLPTGGRLIRVEVFPDFRDPRAVGWLLGLVREVFVDPTATPTYGHTGDRRGWCLVVHGTVMVERVGLYAHEAEILVAAIEAAP